MTSKATSSRRIGFLLFDGITALDVVGPMDAFATAACANAPPHERTKSSYELLLIGITQQDVVAESGLVLKPQVSLSRCPELDTLVVPGGRGLREPQNKQSDFELDRVPHQPYSQNRVGMHWHIRCSPDRFARWAQSRYPLEVRSGRLQALSRPAV